MTCTVTIIALWTAGSAHAYLASEPGESPREITTVSELQNYYKDKPELAQEWKELQKAIQSQKPPEEEAPKEERKAVDALPEPEKQEPPPEEQSLGKKETGPTSEAAMGQLKELDRGQAKTEAPAVDEGREIPVPPGAAPKTPEQQIREKIEKIARAKAQDARAYELYVAGLTDTYFNKEKLGGEYTGKVQAATRAHIEGLEVDQFPTMEFGSVPQGAAATWEGGESNGTGAHITMGEFLETASKGTKRIWDHEFNGHDRDAKKGDGTPLGVNPTGDVEKIAYDTMGCFVGLGGTDCKR
ncbi:MAG: hypothetical protein WC728_09415 [Elusimicrobiota bacterium]